MREIREVIFRGKQTDNGEWIEGAYSPFHLNFGEREEKPHIIIISDDEDIDGLWCEVIPETVGQYTGLTDKNGKKIFEGDIVQYNIYGNLDCQSVVKFGEYNQDGSVGEYPARKCIGFYVDVDNFTCPDWRKDDPDYFPKHFKQQNILEVARDCEVIGNIHDNPEILKGGGNDG